ncbi:MAG: hypothetical protein U0S49_01430 [Rhodospirillales bacterium]|nr:hypothetical protein [Rhodospirillales bacterium]
MSLNRTTLSLLLAGALAAATGEVRADAVRASGSVRGDTGRLTLSWPAPVEFEARSVGGRHILRFARPVEADFAAALAPLHRFLEPPTIGDQGRSVSFPLKPGIVALTFADKTRVVIDLFAGFPPPVAAAQEHAAPVAAAQEHSTPAAAEGLQGIIKPPVAAPNRVARKDAPVVSAAGADAAGAAAPALRFDWAEPVAAAALRPRRRAVAHLRQAVAAGHRPAANRRRPVRARHRAAAASAGDGSAAGPCRRRTRRPWPRRPCLDPRLCGAGSGARRQPGADAAA